MHPHRRFRGSLIFTVLLASLACALAPRSSAGQGEEGPTENDERSLDSQIAGGLDLLRAVDAAQTRLVTDESGELVGLLLLGNATVKTNDFELLADGIGAYRVPPAEVPAADGVEPTASYRLVAQGNILLRRGAQTFRAETLFYDHGNKRAVMTDVRVRLDASILARPKSFVGETQRKKLDATQGNRDSVVERGDETATATSGSEDERTAEDKPTADGEITIGSDLSSMTSGSSAPPSRRKPWEEGRLVLAARELRAENFSHFVGQDIQITTCDFGDPHWAVEAESATVDKVSDAPQGAARPADPTLAPEEEFHYEASLEGTRLRMGSLSIPFLPRLPWDTRWNEAIPLRSLSYSSSSKFGNRVDSLWRGDLLLPRSWRRWIDLGIRVDYLSRRGTGYGAETQWGVKPRRWAREAGQSSYLWGTDLYGTGTFYSINDRGLDRNDVVPETNDRSRARLHQRVRLPWGTLVDAEYSTERDRNFLNEYFETEIRTEKQPENLVYVRQPLTELSQVTLLAKAQKVPFRSVVERRPELSYFLTEQHLGSTGFSLDVTARASDLRFDPADNLNVQTHATTRADLRAVVARAVGNTRWLKLRPFFETRLTAWEDGVPGGNNLERFALATGGSAGMHISRPFLVNVGPYDGLKHTIDPEVSYRLVFENNVDPNRVFRFDPTEDVRRFEQFTFSIRSFLFGRRKPKPEAESGDAELEPHSHSHSHSDSRPATPFRDEIGSGRADRAWRRRRLPSVVAPEFDRLVEFEIETSYFPDPTRDNNRDVWGPIEGELLLRPIPQVGYYLEAAYDVQDGPRFDEFNHGLQFSGKRSVFSIGTRYRRNTGHFITNSIQWFPSDKFAFDAYYSYDFRREKNVDQFYSVVRNFHRWSVMFTLEVDTGEDDNVEFSVRFGPRELWRALRD